MFLSTPILFFTCTPNYDAPHVSESQTLMALKAHSWLFDSLQTHYPDSIYTIVEDEPKIQLDYTDKWLYITIPSGPKDSFFYEVEEPDKLYRWRPENAIDTSDYFIINTLTSNSLIITHDEATYTEYEYYHAQ